MTIFIDDLDYRQFHQLFRQMVEKFDLECWNYCWMSNHYHATIVPRLRNISSAMQWLNGGYAQWWNRRHVKVGHAFQGRFKAQIVQRDGYALALSRYVALNPVRAGLVKRPEEWRWSSYAAIIGLSPAPSFLAIDATLGLFGEANRSVLQKRFADFVLARYEGEVDDRIRSNEHVIGDVAFKTGVRAGSDPFADVAVYDRTPTADCRCGRSGEPPKCDRVGRSGLHDVHGGHGERASKRRDTTRTRRARV